MTGDNKSSGNKPFVELKIRKLKLEDVRKKGVHTLIVGSKSSGKTALLKNIMFHFVNYQQYHKIVVFSSGNDTFYCDQKFKKKDDLDLNYLEKIINKQKNLIRSEGVLPSNAMLIALDDVLPNSKSYLEQKVISDILFNGRHFNIRCILSTSIDISPSLRNNFDYVFLLNTKDTSLKKRWCKLYLGVLNNSDNVVSYVVSNVLSHVLSKRFHALVINNTQAYKDDEELIKSLKWYKTSMVLNKVSELTDRFNSQVNL